MKHLHTDRLPSLCIFCHSLSLKSKFLSLFYYQPVGFIYSAELNSSSSSLPELMRHLNSLQIFAVSTFGTLKTLSHFLRLTSCCKQPFSLKEPYCKRCWPALFTLMFTVITSPREPKKCPRCSIVCGVAPSRDAPTCRPHGPHGKRPPSFASP